MSTDLAAVGAYRKIFLLSLPSVNCGKSSLTSYQLAL